MRLRIQAIILIILSCRLDSAAQSFIMPDKFSTKDCGKWIDRTMSLLQSSSPDCKKTVKILVYGQSISVQDWWLEVRRDLTARFPNANIIMENRAIGGFSTQILYKTVESDVVSFAPDLVLLYDYGSNIYYDSILSTIRSRTTAEIAMNTDHFIGENHWSDTMANHLLPRLAEKNPSEFQDCYFVTRPYNSSGKSWPWELPGMIRVQHTAPWINEEWTCIFKEAEEPYSDFSFSISGAVTGYDGTGRASLDFISDSRRIIIRAGDAEEGGDWHLKRSFKVLKTRVHPGDTIQWKTYSACTDLYIPGQMTPKSVENVTTLFQGVENTRHTLQIIRSGERKPPIKEIRVYRPFWNRI